MIMYACAYHKCHIKLKYLCYSFLQQIVFPHVLQKSSDCDPVSRLIRIQYLSHVSRNQSGTGTVLERDYKVPYVFVEIFLLILCCQ